MPYLTNGKSVFEGNSAWLNVDEKEKDNKEVLNGTSLSRFFRAGL